MNKTLTKRVNRLSQEDQTENSSSNVSRVFFLCTRNSLPRVPEITEIQSKDEIVHISTGF